MTSLYLLFAFSSILWFAASHLLTKRDEAVENPTPANFLRRGYHGSFVLGDFLFIHGGEFSQLVNGVYESGNGPTNSRQNNITFSIDLRTSWSNASLLTRNIGESPAPPLNFEHYWIDPNGKSCYLWNGDWGQSDQNIKDIPSSLWKFSSDEEGGGTWTSIPINYTATSSTAPQRLLRPGGLSSSTTIGSTGYFVGGYIHRGSDVDASPNGYFQNTITSYNISSGQWVNERVTRIGNLGTIQGAEAGTISAMGLDGRGLMVIIGGRDPGTNASEYSGTYFGFDNVTIYDPYIDTWFAQHATGDVPSQLPAVRESFCAVTVAGDNGTYEIFIYGGVNQQAFEVYSDIYVLSIPGFVWFKTQVSSPGRFFHTCNHVGGNQIMSIGGWDNPESSENVWADAIVPDPFLQGIGVFDMTNLVWKDSYDPNATSYKSPKIVKDWYDAGKQESVRWQSLELARMFIRDSPVSVSATPAATGSSSTSTSSSQSGGGSNRAEIIGSVVGSVVGIIGVLLAVPSLWFVWRQWKIMRAAKEPQQTSTKISPQQSDLEDGVSSSEPQVSNSEMVEVLNSTSDGSRSRRDVSSAAVTADNAEPSARNG